MTAEVKNQLTAIIRITTISLSIIFAGTAAMGSLMSSSVTATQHQRVQKTPLIFYKDVMKSNNKEMKVKGIRSNSNEEKRKKILQQTLEQMDNRLEDPS